MNFVQTLEKNEKRTAAEVQTGATEDELEVSVVMPCLNEAETLAICIKKAADALRQANIAGEIIVADNGSSDGSQEIAKQAGARVIHVEAKGYGNALRRGIAAARGRFIVMADSDDSYDFGHTPMFVEKLRTGPDLVMGNRFRGGIKRNAMPLSHRYLGNPAITAIGRLFFHSPCGDFYCGMRGFRKSAYEQMGLRTTGMEFACEMVVKATLLKMKIAEVPTTLSPDGRNRPPHLRTWHDGWRTLRFLLLYSPRWLFLYPGILLILFGAAGTFWLLPGPQRVGQVVFDIHTLLYALMSILLGFQAIAFATFTKVFAISEGLLPEDPRLMKAFRYIKLETGLLVGVLLMLVGFGGSVLAVSDWSARQFGPLNPFQMLRLVSPSVVALTLGFEIILSSFFLSVLGMKRE
ncbi:MAG TPA: glycosyltransferase family 2 protein [Terriglobales bacterium]|nr:glycosyltransferase family 2 protein [Terriglobales bacterium]